MNKFWSLLINKSDVELCFQQEWAREFSLNKQMVLEYWKKFRYLEDIQKICAFNNNKKILDVGCGISTVLHYLNGEKYGIDPLANEYSKLFYYGTDVNIRYGFGENIPFENEYFDFVICSNALDHTMDPQQTINEIYRVLKTNGFFILTVEFFATETRRDLAHPHSFTKDRVYFLLGSKFITIFENTSPWISLIRYVKGDKQFSSEELIMVCQKLCSPEKRSGQAIL